MVSFACVPGLNQAHGEDVADRFESLLGAGGIDAKCFGVPWYSTASFVGDVVEFSADPIRHFFGSPQFRNQASTAVRRRLRELVTNDPSVVVLAHSMGTPLAVLALRQLAAEGIPPPRTVFFGTPYGHPLHSAWLRALGFERTPPRRILSFWNRDDAIVALPGIDPVFPHWLDSVRVAVPNAAAAGQWEHDAEFYLTHPLVIEGLAKL